MSASVSATARCGGSGEVAWNPSPINDPQCEQTAPCPGCTDCTDSVLCYVDGSWAWFTSDLANTWGDDWDDAPHFCNAGDPYTHREDGPELFKVAWDSPVLQPLGVAGGSDPLNIGDGWFSVDAFNRREVPWLCEVTYGAAPVRREREVWGGCTFTEFKAAVEESGGQLYVRAKS